MDAIWSPYFRLAFAKFTDENADKKSNGKLRYSCAGYLPKERVGFSSLDNSGMTDSLAKQLIAQTEEFKKTVQEAIKVEAPKGTLISKVLKDGDAIADDNLAKWELEGEGDPPEWVNRTRGCYVIQLSSEFAPKIYAPKMSAGELAPSEVYDGCWVRAQIRGYSWTFSGKKGWSLGLGGAVQKWQDAASFTSSTSTPDVDDAIELAPPVADLDTID